MSLEKAKNRVILRLVGARFIQFAAVEAGRLDHEMRDEVLHYGSYYSHRIRNQFFPSGEHRFIMSNSFLGSYAYNLALLFLVFDKDRPALQRALRSNLKKFFAECCLGTANCLIGRALLIETLCNEQEDMRGLFEETRTSSALSEKAQKLSFQMSDLLNMHELAHYFEGRMGREWLDGVQALDQGRMGDRIKRWRETLPPQLAVEVICDAFSVSQALSREGEMDDDLDACSRARMAAFGFLCFGELVSLQKSAEATAREAQEQDQSIEVGSEKRPGVQFSYQIGRYTAMDQRCEEMLRMIEEEAAHRSLPLYSEEGFFPLLPDTADILHSAFDAFMEVDDDPDTPPGTSTSSSQRSIAQLLAESLHGYDRGADHLLWRSKQFTIGDYPVDP